MAAVDEKNHSLVYCNAGHNPPLWYKSNRQEFELLNPTGPALGILSEPYFRSQQIQFQPGDIFLFYTDGLSEAQGSGEEFGEERLKDYLEQNQQKTARQILSGLFTTVKSFASEDLDDMTAIILKAR